MARLTRAEKASREKIAADRRAFEAEKSQHAEGLRKVALVEQAQAAALKDPVGFMQRAFGLQPQAILDAIIAEGKKPAATQQEQQRGVAADEMSRRLAEIEKTIQTSAQEQQRQAQAKEADHYKSTVVAPVLADRAKYEFTLRMHGDKAADAVFELQQARYQLTADQVKKGLREKPDIWSPAQAADRIEAHYRSQRDRLNGSSVIPGAPQVPPKVEAPAAKESASPTQKPTPLAGSVMPPRRPEKPYTTKRVS